MTKRNEKQVSEILKKYRREKLIRKKHRLEKERLKALKATYNEKIKFEEIKYPKMIGGIKLTSKIPPSEEKSICGYDDCFWSRKHIRNLKSLAIN